MYIEAQAEMDMYKDWKCSVGSWFETHHLLTHHPPKPTLDLSVSLTQYHCNKLCVTCKTYRTRRANTSICLGHSAKPPPTQTPSSKIHPNMPFFKAPSYMEKAKVMENKPYGWTPESSSRPAELPKPTSNDSSETLVATTTNDATPSSTAAADNKPQLSTLERIKLEREHEKANPKEPLKPAEGIWKSRWMVVPAAILYGFGGG
jgi:hypothetical protein